MSLTSRLILRFVALMLLTWSSFSNSFDAEYFSIPSSTESSPVSYKLPDYELMVRQENLVDTARLLKQELEWIPRGDLEFSILSAWSAGGPWYKYLPDPPHFRPEFSMHLLTVIAGHMSLYPDWKKLRNGLVSPQIYRKIDTALLFVELRQARRRSDHKTMRALYERVLNWPETELIYWFLLKPTGWFEDHYYPLDEDPMLDQIVRFEDKKLIEKLRQTIIKSPPQADMIDVSLAGFDTIAGALEVSKFLMDHAKLEWTRAKLYHYFRIGPDVVDRWLIREIITNRKRNLYSLVLEQFSSLDPVVNLDWLNLAIETNQNFPFRIQKSITGKYEVVRRGFTNSIGQQFLVLEPGEFEVQDLQNQVVPVIQLDGVYMGIHEVTQAQWHAVMGHSDYKISQGAKVYGLGAEGDNYPVHWVSWEMVQEFIKKLNSMESTNAYRLPYEMEWQRACNGGTTEPFGVKESDINQVANFVQDNQVTKLLPVGSMKPNGMGYYDMQGNVEEWTQDWFAYYPEAPLRNYTGPSSGYSKVIRGGSYKDQQNHMNCSNRSFSEPVKSKQSLGFRLVRTNPYVVPLPIRYLGSEKQIDGTLKARLMYKEREIVAGIGESLDNQVKLMSLQALFVTVLDGATGKRHAVYRNFQAAK